MHKFRHLPFGILLYFYIHLSLTQMAYGYIDPGTGSYIFQLLIATLIGGLFLFKNFWRKVKSFFVRIFTKKEK